MVQAAIAVEAPLALVGKVATVWLRITANEIAQYRERSGDTNLLHYDTDFAAKSLFRRPVVPAALVCERLPGLATQLLGDGWAFVGLTNLNVEAAVFPEEEVKMTAMVVECERRQAKIVARVLASRDRPVLRADVLCSYVMRRNCPRSAPTEDA